VARFKYTTLTYDLLAQYFRHPRLLNLEVMAEMFDEPPSAEQGCNESSAEIKKNYYIFRS
jgi:hypothetical protein